MTQSIFYFKRSREFRDFEIWCDEHGHQPFSMLKRYMKEVVLHNKDPCGFDINIKSGNRLDVQDDREV